MAQLNNINADGTAQTNGAVAGPGPSGAFSPWQSPIYDPETGNFTFPGFGQGPTATADAAPAAATADAPAPTAAGPSAFSFTGPNDSRGGGQTASDTAAQANDQASRGTVDPSALGLDGINGSMVGHGIGLAGSLVTGNPIGMAINGYGLFNDIVGAKAPATDAVSNATAANATGMSPPGTSTEGSPANDGTGPGPGGGVNGGANGANGMGVGGNAGPAGGNADAPGGGAPGGGGPGDGADGGGGTGDGTGKARGGLIGLPSLPKPSAGLGGINAGGGGFAASAARRFGTNASGGVNAMPLGGAANAEPGFNAPPQRLARGGLTYKAPMPGGFRSGFSSGSIPQNITPQPTQQQRYAGGGTVISGAMDEDHARALHYASGGDIRAPFDQGSGGAGTSGANQAFTGGDNDGDQGGQSDGQGDHDFSGMVQGAGDGNDDDVKANLGGQEPTAQGRGSEIDLSNGEFVLDEQTTKFFGPDFLKNLQAIAAKASGMPAGTDDDGNQPPAVAGAQQPGGINQQQGQVAPPAEDGVNTGQGDDFLTQQEQAIGPDGAGYGMAQGAGAPTAPGQPSTSPMPDPTPPPGGGRAAGGGPLGNGWSSTSGYPSPIQPRDVPMAGRPVAAVGGNGEEEGRQQGFVNSRSMVPTDDGIAGKGSRTAGGLRSIHAR